MGPSLHLSARYSPTTTPGCSPCWLMAVLGSCSIPAVVKVNAETVPDSIYNVFPEPLVGVVLETAVQQRGIVTLFKSGESPIGCAGLLASIASRSSM